MPVLEIPVDSLALAANPLGDPARRVLHVLVPEDHDPAAAIPCVWWLAGYAGVGRQMLAGDLWQEGLEARVARLRAEGRLGRMAIALPDAFTRYGGCQYLSSPAVGDYERYLYKELPAALEGHVRVSRHGVAGKSSGGFGALAAAMRQPGLFEAAVSHSGDMGFDLSVFPDLPLLMNAVRDHGGLEAVVEAHARSVNKKEGRWFGPLSMIALGAVYAPDPESPLGIALPFDLDSGQLDAAVLERWRSFDPVIWAERSAEARSRLSALRLLFFDCGRRDEHHLHWGARRFAAVLRRHGVGFEHEEFDGGHRSTSHRLDVSLPKLYAALA